MCMRKTFSERCLTHRSAAVCAAIKTPKLLSESARTDFTCRCWISANRRLDSPCLALALVGGLFGLSVFLGVSPYPLR